MSLNTKNETVEVNFSLLPKEIREKEDSLMVGLGTGISMLPTFKPGGKVLVDTSSKDIESGNIYFIEKDGLYPGNLYYWIKRLYVNDNGTISITSDNLDNEPIILPLDEFEVHGKIVALDNGDDFESVNEMPTKEHFFQKVWDEAIKDERFIRDKETYGITFDNVGITVTSLDDDRAWRYKNKNAKYTIEPSEQSHSNGSVSKIV